MQNDPWPDEPDEPDPEADLRTPESELPSVPEAPTVRDTSAVEVSTEVATAFWSVVVLVNVGLFGASLGLMLVYFRNDLELGGGLLLLGAFALVHAYRRYRQFERERSDRDDGSGDENDGGDGDGTTADGDGGRAADGRE